MCIYTVVNFICTLHKGIDICIWTSERGCPSVAWSSLFYYEKHRADYEEREMSCLCLLLLPLQLLKHSLELLLLLLGLLNGRLVLLVVSHGHHGQDQVHQVKGAQEDHQHKEDHVGFSCCTQSLMGKKQEFQVEEMGCVFT